MTLWPDFAGEVRWGHAGLGLRVDHRGALIDATSTAGRRVLVIGELNRPETNVAGKELRSLLTDDSMRELGSVAGGFAAAVADPVTQTLLLATDPFGIRPVYYWSDGERVVFATRLADLRRVGDLAPALDWPAVYDYLNFSYVPGPGTIFRDVLALPPGYVARCRRGKVEVSCYWDMTYPADAVGSEAELAAALRHHIDRAVRASWPSDVPRGTAGCFLSGGTDSGTIAALLSKLQTPLKVYSIAFTEDAYNELAYAKVLSDRYNFTHHVHHLTPDDLLGSITHLVADLDQPFGNPSLVATWRCTRLARDTGVQLLLAGDGGDELFGGNTRYAKDRVYAVYQRLPSWSRRGLLALAESVPGHALFLKRLRNFAYRGTLANPERLYSDDAFASRYWDTLVTPELRHRVSRDASLEVVREHYQRSNADSELDRLLYVDLKMAIWGNDLVKVSTAARAEGVRVRFPFLDPALARFTGRLDVAMKVRGLEKRYLFKRAVSDLLPEQILRKPKHGFSVPVSHWIRHDRRVRAAVLDPILDPHSLIRDCFTTSGIERLVEDHLRGRWDHGAWLWALMMLARWDDARETGRAA